MAAKRKSRTDVQGTGTVRWQRLPKLALGISLLSLLVSVLSWGFGVCVYFSGTKPQTDFQRVDVELQRVKQRLHEETAVVDSLRSRGSEVAERERILQKATNLYNDAWDAWLVEHDFQKAERLLRDSARELPRRAALPLGFLLIFFVALAVVSLTYFLLRRFGFVGVERTE